MLLFFYKVTFTLYVFYKSYPRELLVAESKENIYYECTFGKNYFCQLILLFSLFLLLFIGPIVFFGTIHRSHSTISVNFYLYLQYFQQNDFSFSKISRSQMNSKYVDFWCEIIVENYWIFFSSLSSGWVSL